MVNIFLKPAASDGESSLPRFDVALFRFPRPVLRGEGKGEGSYFQVRPLILTFSLKINSIIASDPSIRDARWFWRSRNLESAISKLARRASLGCRT